MRFARFAPFALMLCAAAHASGVSGASVSEVRRAEEARLRAEVAVDMKTLDRLVASDMHYVHANGEGQDRAAYLAAVARAAGPVRDARLSDRSIVVNGSAAFTHGRVDYLLRTDNQPRPARFTAAYRKEHGIWRLVSWQNTAVRAEP